MAAPPTVVAVSIPDVSSVYNQKISVPVSVSETSGLGIVSAEIFICFSNAASGGLLSVFSAGVTPTALTAGWTIESNIADGPLDLDTLKIAMATDNNTLVGRGDLVG